MGVHYYSLVPVFRIFQIKVFLVIKNVFKKLRISPGDSSVQLRLRTSGLED